MQQEYRAKKTLPHLIRTATRFAGAEKSGVHAISRNEPKVIDLEIAFPSSSVESEQSVPRMDIAVLVPNSDGSASIVFCEAKCADNKELWTLEVDNKDPSKSQILVCAQIKKYERFIRENKEVLIEAYLDVCKALVEMSRGITRAPDALIAEVAAKRVRLSIHPNIFLLVFDFDDDQKKGAVKRRLNALKEQSVQVIAKGDPKSFRLVKDILNHWKNSDANR